MNISYKKTLATTMLSIALFGGSLAIAETPKWQPEVSERLIQLPTQYLQKSLDHDFANSSLGQAMVENNSSLEQKNSNLQQLSDAIKHASHDANLHLELRHQMLEEKRNYIDLMDHKIALRKNQTQARLNFYEQMLKKMKSNEDTLSPQRQELVQQQRNANERFEASLDKVNMKVFADSYKTESKYASKYEENNQAIQKILAHIEKHSMNTSPSTHGNSVTKEQFLRDKMMEQQSQLALIEQEKTLLGYMAKLVALDAMALSEEALDAELADSNLPGNGLEISASVDLFLQN